MPPGPMAHPIRPESYIKMDNFYTLTVYEKGEAPFVTMLRCSAAAGTSVPNHPGVAALTRHVPPTSSA